jgi:hypothetical protein
MMLSTNILVHVPASVVDVAWAVSKTVAMAEDIVWKRLWESSYNTTEETTTLDSI